MYRITNECIEKELKELAENGPTQEHFNMAIENFKKNLPESRINNGYWMNCLQTWNKHGINHDVEYEEAINTLTPEDVKAAALNIQTDRMYFRNYRNGCCYDFCNVGWWLGMLKYRYPERKNLKDAIHRPYYKIIERIIGEDVPEYTDMLLNDEYNDFCKNYHELKIYD